MEFISSSPSIIHHQVNIQYDELNPGSFHIANPSPLFEDEDEGSLRMCDGR